MQEYEGRVAAEEQRVATSGEEYTEDDVALARLDAGLYTLQQVPPPTFLHPTPSPPKQPSRRHACQLDNDQAWSVRTSNMGSVRQTGLRASVGAAMRGGGRGGGAGA